MSEWNVYDSQVSHYMYITEYSIKHFTPPNRRPSGHQVQEPSFCWVPRRGRTHEVELWPEKGTLCSGDAPTEVTRGRMEVMVARKGSNDG